MNQSMKNLKCVVIFGSWKIDGFVRITLFSGMVDIEDSSKWQTGSAKY